MFLTVQITMSGDDVKSLKVTTLSITILSVIAIVLPQNKIMRQSSILKMWSSDDSTSSFMKCALATYLSVCLSKSLYEFICQCISLCLSLYLPLPLCVCLLMTMSLSVYVSRYPPVCLPAYLSLRVSCI